ncbi:hypothetical protein EJ110_NYTH38189 [Nymphaea thermarum]|nr:hypothetical protein EJ110_NYTH38189 [Nymphaea thermarum]
MPEELKVFASHASQTAAIDYIVSVENDVFVPSYSGNMAKAVEGHHRFLGHRMTISPDRKGLVELFDKTEAGELKEGPFFSSLVSQMHKSRKGPLPGVKGRAWLRTEESFMRILFLNASVRRVTRAWLKKLESSLSCILFIMKHKLLQGYALPRNVVRHKEMSIPRTNKCLQVLLPAKEASEC